MSIGEVFAVNTRLFTMVVLAACISMMAAVASPGQDLDSVTARASNYVVDYEQELGWVTR